ncbi:hypothetical protein HDV05_001903 [Chytridiales sp. JEL 0842]|nr:hypothetical protein HDV05_001903 [Chytridiales sp. JEL 0842]
MSQPCPTHKRSTHHPLFCVYRRFTDAHLTQQILESFQAICKAKKVNGADVFLDASCLPLEHLEKLEDGSVEGAVNRANESQVYETEALAAAKMIFVVVTEKSLEMMLGGAKKRALDEYLAALDATLLLYDHKGTPFTPILVGRPLNSGEYAPLDRKYFDQATYAGQPKLADTVIRILEHASALKYTNSTLTTGLEMFKIVVPHVKNAPINFPPAGMKPFLRFRTRSAIVTRFKEKALIQEKLEMQHICIIGGAPGIGKSTEAAQFLFFNHRKYEIYVWLNCQSPDRIRLSIIDAREKIVVDKEENGESSKSPNGTSAEPTYSKDKQVPTIDLETEAEMFKPKFCKWLAETENYVLVLDGADNPECVACIFGCVEPFKFKGDVLVTSSKETAIYNALKPYLRVTSTNPESSVEKMVEDKGEDLSESMSFQTHRLSSPIVQLKWWREEEVYKFAKARYIANRKIQFTDANPGVKLPAESVLMPYSESAALRRMAIRLEGSPMLADLIVSYVVWKDIGFQALWDQLLSVEMAISQSKILMAQAIMNGRPDERLLMVMFNLMVQTVNRAKDENHRRVVLTILDVFRIWPTSLPLPLDFFLDIFEFPMTMESLQEIVTLFLVVPGLVVCVDMPRPTLFLRQAFMLMLRSSRDPISNPKQVLEVLVSPLLKADQFLIGPFLKKRMMMYIKDLSKTILKMLQTRRGFVPSCRHPDIWSNFDAGLRLAVAEFVAGDHIEDASYMMKLILDLQVTLHNTLDHPRISCDLESYAELLSWMPDRWLDLHIVHQETVKSLMGSYETADDVRIARQYISLAAISRELEDTRGARDYMLVAVTTFVRTYKTWEHLDVLKAVAALAALCLEDRDAVMCIQYARKGLDIADALDVLNRDLVGRSPVSRYDVIQAKKIKAVLVKAINQSIRRTRPEAVLDLAPSVKEISDRQHRQNQAALEGTDEEARLMIENEGDLIRNALGMSHYRPPSPSTSDPSPSSNPHVSIGQLSTAFALYRINKEKDLAANGTQESYTPNAADFTRLTALMWKDEPDTVKSLYKDLSLKIMRLHKILYPDLEVAANMESLRRHRENVFVRPTVALGKKRTAAAAAATAGKTLGNEEEGGGGGVVGNKEAQVPDVVPPSKRLKSESGSSSPLTVPEKQAVEVTAAVSTAPSAAASASADGTGGGGGDVTAGGASSVLPSPISHENGDVKMEEPEERVRGSSDGSFDDYYVVLG